MLFEDELHRLRPELNSALFRMADWWCANTPDLKQGGFFGEVGADGRANLAADKSIILNTRILWFFSELSLYSSQPEYRAMADRAYQYLVDHFEDKQAGGVYWMLNAEGEVIDSKKQVYAQCFAIYALSSYFRLTKNIDAILKARKIQSLLELLVWDDEQQGYLDAFDECWQEIDDSTLGDADQNAPKKMNTHLHLLEAYTGLHIAAPTLQSAHLLEKSIHCYCKYFIDHEHFHLNMFFDKNWTNQTTWHSLGHEIESSWLLDEALNALAKPEVTRQYEFLVEGMAGRCLDIGQGFYGEFKDELRKDTGFNSERVWWIQAEAMVGFFNAFQRTEQASYYCAFLRTWQFTKCEQIDENTGEWLWFSRLDKQESAQYLMGAWKGPYHNGRALLQLIERIDQMTGASAEQNKVRQA